MILIPMRVCHGYNLSVNSSANYLPNLGEVRGPRVILTNPMQIEFVFGIHWCLPLVDAKCCSVL